MRRIRDIAAALWADTLRRMDANAQQREVERRKAAEEAAAAVRAIQQQKGSNHA